MHDSCIGKYFMSRKYLILLKRTAHIKAMKVLYFIIYFALSNSKFKYESYWTWFKLFSSSNITIFGISLLKWPPKLLLCQVAVYFANVVAKLAKSEHSVHV